MVKHSLVLETFSSPLNQYVPEMAHTFYLFIQYGAKIVLSYPYQGMVIYVSVLAVIDNDTLTKERVYQH